MNSTHKLHLIDKYFNLIKDGIKTVEIRLNDEKRQKMKVGDYIDIPKEKIKDYIEFINNNTEEILLTIIKDKKVVDNVLDLYEIYDEKSLGISKKEIVKVMKKIYSKEELKSNKICAIEIEKK